jgi:hypothetical protein
MNNTDQPMTTGRQPAGGSTTGTPAPSPRSCDDHGPAQHDGFTARIVGWGLVVGVANAAAPITIWWLAPSTVYALAIALIASIYIGFAVADGRPRVIAVECSVAGSFVLLAAIAITVSPWLLVAGYFLHGCKDLWQHRTRFVTGTRWWPPFCATVDWAVAGIIAIAIGSGTAFH